MIPTAVLRSSVSIKANRGETAYEPVDEDAATYPCRILPSQRLVRSADGSVVDSVAKIELRPDVAISPQDEATVDDVTYRVLAVEPQSQLSRPFSLIATLGRSET